MTEFIYYTCIFSRRRKRQRGGWASGANKYLIQLWSVGPRRAGRRQPSRWYQASTRQEHQCPATYEVLLTSVDGYEIRRKDRGGDKKGILGSFSILPGDVVIVSFTEPIWGEVEGRGQLLKTCEHVIGLGVLPYLFDPLARRLDSRASYSLADAAHFERRPNPHSAVRRSAFPGTKFSRVICNILSMCI